MIRRLGFVLGLLAALALPANAAGWLPLAQAPSGGGCSQATTFLARTSGLDSTHQTLYTNLICGMVTDGTGCSSWGAGGNLDILYILMTQTSTAAALNLCSTSFSLTPVNSPTFTADQGYAGNGTSSYLNTNWNPSTNGVNFTQNSASLSVYLPVSRAGGASGVQIGCESPRSYIKINTDGAGASFVAVNSTSDNNLGGGANTKGSWILSRTGAASVSWYKNGNTTPVNTTTTASSGVSANTVFIGADNFGAAGGFSADSIAAAFAGGGQTSASQKLVSDRINAFATGLSTPINVY